MSTDDTLSVSTPNAPDTTGLESGPVTRRDSLRSAGALTAMAGVHALSPG
ncbi:MAG: hypothetical protein ABEL97_08760 [Salinibacter sp.]